MKSKGISAQRAEFKESSGVSKVLLHMQEAKILQSREAHLTSTLRLKVWYKISPRNSLKCRGREST